MSEDTDLPESLAGQPAARPLPLLPGRAGPAGIRRRGAPGHPARPARRWSRWSCPATLQRRLPARASTRLPEMSVIFYPDEASDEDRAIYVPVEPADPFAEAMRTARGDRRGGRSSSSPIPANARICRTPIRTRTRSGASASTSTSRPIASSRSRARTRSRRTPPAWPGSCRAPIRWRSVLVVVSLNLLDPLLDAMEKPQAQPMARVRREGVRGAESASGMPGRDHHRVSVPAGALRTLPRPDDGLRSSSTAATRNWRSVARPRRSTRPNTGESVAALAAAPDRALHAQPGADRAASWCAGVFDLAVAARSIVDDNYGWEVWEMADRYPRAEDARAT